MTKFRKAFDAGRAKSAERLEIMQDPVGQDQDHDRLRAMGKWRFVVTRGILGWGIPMFLWIVLSNLPGDLRSAEALHQSTLQHLFHSWVAAFGMNALLGIVVGVLAWRRLTSDAWPGAKPDPDACITRL